MTSRHASTSIALALLAFGLAGTAQAQPSEAQMNAIKSSCRSDFMSNCRGVKTGGAEAFQCLKKNEASLSAACRTAVNAVAAPVQPKPAAAAPAPAPAPTPAPAAASAAPASPPPAAAPVAAPAVTAAPSPAPHQAAPKPAAQQPAAPKPAAAAKPAQPTAAQQNALKQNCRNDFMAHCAGVQPGGAEALTCLQTNAPKLTPACKSAVAAIGGAPAAKPAATAAAPAAAPVAPAPAAMPAPRLDSPMEARLIKRFCFTDFKVLCRGVPLGQGRAVQCLAANAPALSPTCRQAMAAASR